MALGLLAGRPGAEGRRSLGLLAAVALPRVLMGRSRLQKADLLSDVLG